MNLAKYILIAALVVCTQSAYAHDSICPAVWPCEDNGDIAAQFDVAGDCGDQFRAQCAEVKISYCSQDLKESADSISKLKSDSEKLTKKNKRLRSKIRKLKLRLK